jgi:plastocyanin
MKKIVILSLLLASSLIFGGCSLYGGSQNNSTSSTTTSNTPTQMPATGSTTIDIQNFSFNPSILTVKTGSTVTWTNHDSVNHQIKSDTFGSNPLSTNQTYSFTFTTAGTYNYFCAIHPSMTGTIIVQ